MTMRSMVLKYVRKTPRVIVAEGFVRSESDPKRWYNVFVEIDRRTCTVLHARCTCDDFYYRKRLCKHIYALYREVTKYGCTP